ncbi:MAG: hypothetical protein V2B19_18540 [Pseudomonadota bacterium]
MIAIEHTVTLRRFPHPFQAALALCPDIDDCTRHTFRDVHLFLNRDLGLPAADSFFGHGRSPGQMAYFESGTLKESADAPIIREAIRSGLIDSLHSWGDFNHAPPVPDYLRAMAERLTGSLLAHDLKIPVWINHGDPHNCQNLKSRLRPEYQGDAPGAPYYTADLLKKLGLKYVWPSELVNWPLSVSREHVLPRAWLRRKINRVKNLVKFATGQKNRKKTTEQLDELCYSFPLRDGTTVMAFTRFYQDLDENPEATRLSIHRTITPGNLDRLIDQEGYMVFYTHFGLPSGRNGPLFPERDQHAFELLARHFHDGRIWMARTPDILNFWLLQKYLRWNFFKEGEAWVINLENVDDPVEGTRPPCLQELAGLCFYAPQPERTVIRLEGRDVPAVIHGPDHRGLKSIGFPPPLPPETDFLLEIK